MSLDFKMLVRRAGVLLVWLVLAGVGFRAAASQSVELTWSPSPSANIVGYKVHSGTQSGVYVDTITYGVVSDVVVPGLAQGNTYYFAVSAIDVDGNESALSNEAVYYLPPPDSIVLQVQGSTAGLQAVQLDWTPSSDADVYGYQVRYGTQSGVYTNSTMFFYATEGIISGLAGGATYYFTVSPVDSFGSQPTSADEVAYTVPAPPPLVLSAQMPQNSAGVELSWNDTAGEINVNYIISYGTQSGIYTQSISCGEVDDFVVHGLTPGQIYYFIVCFQDNFGNQSAASNEASSPAAAPIPVTLIVQPSTAAMRAVEVSWTPSADPSVYGYWVNYWEPGADTTNYQAFYGVTDGVIAGLSGGATYEFTISPIDNFGVESVASAAAACTVPDPPPIVLSAHALADSPGVELTWNPVEDQGINYYNVYYWTSGGDLTSTTFGLETDVVMRGLSGGQTYYFTVTSVDSFGNESAYSTEASAVAPIPPPMMLQMHTYLDDDGQPYGMEITTPSTVYGSWEMDCSSDLVNWSYYASGYGQGNGDGYDVDVFAWIDPAQPQMYFRVVNN